MKKFVVATLLVLSLIACTKPVDTGKTNAAQDTAAFIAADSAAKAVDTIAPAIAPANTTVVAPVDSPAAVTK